MVRRSAEAVMAAVPRLTVVTGYQPDLIREALAGLDATFVHNPDYASGLGLSLAAGIRALPGSANGVVVGLADMPFVLPQTVSALVAAFREADSSVVVPVYDGTRGNPVVWPRRCYSALAHLSGDFGGRRLLRGEALHELPVDDPGVLRDVDILADLDPAETGPLG